VTNYWSKVKYNKGEKQDIKSFPNKRQRNFKAQIRNARNEESSNFTASSNWRNLKSAIKSSDVLKIGKKLGEYHIKSEKRKHRQV